MEDQGQILTHFEAMFGGGVKPETIKIVLQTCNWDISLAAEELLSFCNNSNSLFSEEAKENFGTNTPLCSNYGQYLTEFPLIEESFRKSSRSLEPEVSLPYISSPRNSPLHRNSPLSRNYFKCINFPASKNSPGSRNSTESKNFASRNSPSSGNHFASKTISCEANYSSCNSTNEETPKNYGQAWEEEDVAVFEEEDIAVSDPQEYRNEAQIHYLERRKAFLNAKEASQKGMKEDARNYARLGKFHDMQFKEANKRASKKILSALNCNKDPHTLDLHLQHIPDALAATRSFLIEQKCFLAESGLPQLQVKIITGKGIHSAGGQPRLKPALKEFLDKENYDVHVYVGMFKLNLKP